MSGSFNVVPLHFEHALIVGGTGMLANATRFVRARSEHVTLVSRRANKAAAGLAVLPTEACSLDWRNTANFAAQLLPRIASLPPDLSLLWIHGNGHRTLLWLLGQLMICPVLIVHVLGSASGDPRINDPEINAILNNSPRMRYVTVVLGSKSLPDGGRRWLTDEEISLGTVEAIQTARNVVVGEITPAM
jgi:hypothetical protein